MNQNRPALRAVLKSELPSVALGVEKAGRAAPSPRWTTARDVNGISVVNTQVAKKVFAIAFQCFEILWFYREDLSLAARVHGRALFGH